MRLPSFFYSFIVQFFLLLVFYCHIVIMNVRAASVSLLIVTSGKRQMSLEILCLLRTEVVLKQWLSSRNWIESELLAVFGWDYGMM